MGDAPEEKMAKMSKEQQWESNESQATQPIGSEGDTALSLLAFPCSPAPLNPKPKPKPKTMY